MKQKIFTPEYVTELMESIEANMSKYRDPNYDWEEDAEGRVRELDFEQPDLSGMNNYTESKRAIDDCKAAKILFEGYRDNLSPLQAAQRHFWQYLSHVVLKDYMRARWEGINSATCPASYIKEHWFYAQGRIRNWLEGLYWSVYCTVIENEDGTLDYKYTDFFFSIQKLRDRGIGAATYVMSNPALIQGILDFYMDELAKKEKGGDTVFDKYFEYRTDECIQLINKLGGVVELSALTKQDVYNFLNENRNYIKNVGDRKKEKKLRDEAVAANGSLAVTPTPNTNRKKKRKHKKR